MDVERGLSQNPGTASLALKLCSHVAATENTLLEPKESSIGEREGGLLCQCHLRHPSGKHA